MQFSTSLKIEGCNSVQLHPLYPSNGSPVQQMCKFFFLVSDKAILRSAWSKLVVEYQCFWFETDFWNSSLFFFSGSSIHQLLPILFYPIGPKEEEVVGLTQWIKVLQFLGLADFVKNKSLLKFMKRNNLNDAPWYYIGPLGKYLSQRTLDTWNGIFLEIFLNLKPMKIAKKSYSIICRSINVMHFCQIIRAWLNIRACHAHLKFEM